jgi:hypothetical protein
MATPAPAFSAIPMRRVITTPTVYAKPEQATFDQWFANPRMSKSERTKRPKLGSNPYQPLDAGFQTAFGSAGKKRAAFRPAFASKTGFSLYTKSHPKSGLRQEWKDIDGDAVPDALVYNSKGEIIGVNGMVVKDSNWSTLSPYYDTSAKKRLAWEKSQGFRADDDTSKISGISKQWKERFLKHVYDMVLSKDVEGISEEELEFITEIRKEYPVSKLAKAFIQELMTQEAIKALQQNGFQPQSEGDAERAIKSLTSTKKFKAYIYQLAMSAAQTEDYFLYLANLIRDYIYNASKGKYDISRTKAWQSKQLEVRDGGENLFTVQVPAVAVPAQAQGGLDEFVAKLQQLYSQLESAETQESDPNMQSLARSLRMPGASTATNGNILDWVQHMAQQLGVA